MFNAPVLDGDLDMSDLAFQNLLNSLAGFRTAQPNAQQCPTPVPSGRPTIVSSAPPLEAEAGPSCSMPPANIPEIPPQPQPLRAPTEGAYPLPPFLHTLAERAAQNMPAEGAPHQGNLNQRPLANSPSPVLTTMARAPARRRSRPSADPWARQQGPDSNFISLLGGSRNITGIENPTLRALFSEFTPFKLFSDPNSFRQKIFERLASIQECIEEAEGENDWELVATFQREYNQLYASYHARYLPLQQRIGHRETITLIRNQGMSHSSTSGGSSTIDIMLDMIQSPGVMNAFSKIFQPRDVSTARAARGDADHFARAFPSVGGFGRNSSTRNRSPVTDVTNLFDVQCHYCHEFGHFKSGCLKLKRKLQNNNSRGNDRNQGPPGPPGNGRNPN